MQHFHRGGTVVKYCLPQHMVCTVPNRGTAVLIHTIEPRPNEVVADVAGKLTCQIFIQTRKKFKVTPEKSRPKPKPLRTNTRTNQRRKSRTPRPIPQYQHLKAQKLITPVVSCCCILLAHDATTIRQNNNVVEPVARIDTPTKARRIRNTPSTRNRNTLAHYHLRPQIAIF